MFHCNKSTTLEVCIHSRQSTIHNICSELWCLRYEWSLPATRGHGHVPINGAMGWVASWGSRGSAGHRVISVVWRGELLWRKRKVTMKVRERVWVSMKVKLPAAAETNFAVQTWIYWDSVQVLRPWCNVTVKESQKELCSAQRQEFTSSISGLLLQQAAYWRSTNVASLFQEALNLRRLYCMTTWNKTKSDTPTCRIYPVKIKTGEIYQ